MSNLTRRLSDAIEEIKAERGYGRIPREAKAEVKEVQLGVLRERGRGVIATERLNAGARTARAALINTGMLSKEEELLIQFAPLCDARVKAIVDAYAIYAAGEVSQL